MNDDALSLRRLDSNLESFKKFHATRKWRGAIKAVMAVNRIRAITDSPRPSTFTDSNDEADEFDWVNQRPDSGNKE